jgi:DNA polymerase
MDQKAPTPSNPEFLTPELHTLKAQVLTCTLCPLHAGKTHYVFGEGKCPADLMFIGEGPGKDEDTTGRPFVGKAGQLLTRIIESMNLKREDVYIANVVKCRPPDNRVPTPDEASACLPYLHRQIELIRPKVLVLLGATAACYVLGQKVSITKLRGSWIPFQTASGHALKIMPTFHPAALLRNPSLKREVWEDMKQVMSEIKNRKV